MTFRDLADVIGIRKKELPIHGQIVSFPGTISARSGLLLQVIQQQVATIGEQADAAAVIEASGMTDEDALKLEAELLGDGAEALDRLGVLGEARQHVVGTLATWHMSGPEAAEAVWEGKAQPSAENRATRRRTAGQSSAGNGKGGKGGTRSRAVGGAASGGKAVKGAGGRTTRRSSSGTGKS